MLRLYHYASAAFLALATTALLAADSPDKAPDPKIVPVVNPFPDLPQPPPPLTPLPVDPTAVPTLSDGWIYLVKNDESFTLRASPKGLVKITRSGPLLAYGRFIDSASGDFDLRTITAKHVAIVTPIKGASGRVELIYSPTGAPDDSTDITRMVLVNQGPQPPPDPGPKPPDPPKPPVVVTSFRVILVFESGDTLTAAQTSVLYGKTVETFLNATCTGGKAGWRRRDKDLGSENDPTMKPIWDAVKAEFAAPKNTKTPAFVIQVNDKITIEPAPATPAEAVALLKKYSEGK